MFSKDVKLHTGKQLSYYYYVRLFLAGVNIIAN